jgi:hypothetical protein
MFFKSLESGVGVFVTSFTLGLAVAAGFAIPTRPGDYLIGRGEPERT